MYIYIYIYIYDKLNDEQKHAPHEEAKVTWTTKSFLLLIHSAQAGSVLSADSCCCSCSSRACVGLGDVVDALGRLNVQHVLEWM